MFRSIAATLALCLSAPAAAAEARVIDSAALKARMNGPPASWDFTLVDARTEVEFSEGHIPGAILIPANRTAERLPRVQPDKGRAVVFYCNGPLCTKTVKAGTAALAAGYTNVLEYKEGLPGWGKAGQRVEGKPLPKVEAPAVSSEELRAGLARADGPLVVDIRDPEEYAKYRIEGARSVPLDDLRGSLRSFPAGRAIVLVDHAGHQSPVAVRLLASLGRSDVRRLDGGIVRWQQKGLAVVQ